MSITICRCSRCWRCCGTWLTATTCRQKSWTRPLPLTSRSSTTAALRYALGARCCHAARVHSSWSVSRDSYSSDFSQQVHYCRSQWILVQTLPSYCKFFYWFCFVLFELRWLCFHDIHSVVLVFLSQALQASPLSGSDFVCSSLLLILAHIFLSNVCYSGCCTPNLEWVHFICMEYM